MKALGIVLMVVIIFGLFLLAWYVLRSPKKKQVSVPDFVEPQEVKIFTDNNEFKNRYKTFYSQMIDYINNRSVENRKSVNDAITSLSSLVCSSENTLPNILYMRKITILSEIFDLSSSKESSSNGDLKSKRNDLSKISSELAAAYSSCLQVNQDNLKKFFDFSDTLFILYKQSTSAERKEVINKNFLTLIEKLSIKA